VIPPALIAVTSASRCVCTGVVRQPKRQEEPPAVPSPSWPTGWRLGRRPVPGPPQPPGCPAVPQPPAPALGQHGWVPLPVASLSPSVPRRAALSAQPRRA